MLNTSRFCLWARKDASQYLRKGGILPSKGLLCMFKNWEFETSIGMIREHITLKSSKNTWYTFKSAYERETGNCIPPDIADDVREVGQLLELPNMKLTRPRSTLRRTSEKKVLHSSEGRNISLTNSMSNGSSRIYGVMMSTNSSTLDSDYNSALSYCC